MTTKRRTRRSASQPPVVLLPEAAVERLLLGLAILLFLVLRLPCARIPLERDEGAYAYVAQRVLSGDAPYRDIFDHKPPLIYLAYLVPVGLFGTSVLAIHALSYASSAVAAVLLFWCLRKLAGSLAASFGCLVFVVLTIEPCWQTTAANTEQFMLPALLGSLACILEAEESCAAGAWLAAGALAAVACWIKPVAATDAVFLAVFALVRFRLRAAGGRTASPRGAAGLASAGAALVSLLLVGALALRGSLHGFVDAVFVHNLDYASEMPMSAGLRILESALAAQAPSLWAIGLAAAATMFDLRRGRRLVSIALLAALASAGAGIAVGAHFYPHYFLQAAPVLASAAGISMSRAMVGVARAAGPGRALAAAVAVSAAVIAPGLVHDAPFFFRDSPEEKSRALYGINPFDVSASIAARLASLTGPDDAVLVYGSEPQILFLARRRSATRYIEFYPLTLSGEAALRRQEEAWAEIVRSSPKAILMTEVETSLFEDARSPKLLRANVTRMLASGFRLEGVRIFHGSSRQMAFGEAARKFAQAAERTGRSEPADMFLFVRESEAARTLAR
jgi:4-amino-4-deoxy-L-arabinose transferase-like glycosyltransferase